MDLPTKSPPEGIDGETPPALKLDPSESPATRSNPRLLLIDDDKTFRSAMENSAREAGVNLTTCFSLDDFGRMPSHRHFDVVILDYYQGDLTGAQFAAVLGEKPVLLVSSQRPPDIQSWQGDIRQFLPKSSGPETVLATALFLASSPETGDTPPNVARIDNLRRDQILDTIRRLIKTDDPAFVREVVDLFLAQSAGIILNVHAALNKQNREELLRLVQDLRANSANVGAQSLARWSALLEDRAQDGKWERCRLLAKGLNAEFRRLRELLEK